MLLLYCNIAAAVVLGIHDDGAAAVPASAYGTGVRIIPWSAGYSALTKSGTAPPAGMPDTRPYAQPTETPAILISYAGQCRFNSSIEGISFTAASGVIPVKTDRISQSLLSNLSTYAATLAPTTAMDFTQDGVHYVVTAAEVISMSNAVMAHIQNGRSIEARCIADQNATTPQYRTYADIDTQFAGA